MRLRHGARRIDGAGPIGTPAWRSAGTDPKKVASPKVKMPPLVVEDVVPLPARRDGEVHSEGGPDHGSGARSPGMDPRKAASPKVKMPPAPSSDEVAVPAWRVLEPDPRGASDVHAHGTEAGTDPKKAASPNVNTPPRPRRGSSNRYPSAWTTMSMARAADRGPRGPERWDRAAEGGVSEREDAPLVVKDEVPEPARRHGDVNRARRTCARARSPESWHRPSELGVAEAEDAAHIVGAPGTPAPFGVVAMSMTFA